jgi:hypothetical protein
VALVEEVLDLAGLGLEVTLADLPPRGNTSAISGRIS